MAALDQIPVPWEIDLNVNHSSDLYHREYWEMFGELENPWDETLTATEDAQDSATEIVGNQETGAQDSAAEIVGNQETQEQLNMLTFLQEKYENGELKDIHRAKYENLMSDVRNFLDETVPTVIEMNEEININYYKAHPEEAKKFANAIVWSYENWEDVYLIKNVVVHKDYLSNDNQQKLYKAINEFNKEISDLFKKSEIKN